MAVEYKPRPTSQEAEAGSLFEDLGANMASLYGQAEADMIAEVARHAKGAIDDPQRARIIRAKVLADLRAKGEALAANLSNPNVARQLIAIAAEQGEAAAIARLGLDQAVGGSITPAAANATAGIALNLTNDLGKMSDRITRWMPDTYQRVISMVTPNVVLGVDTLAQAQRKAAESFIARGVTGFTDAAGRDWRIGTYAEMATRTSVNRAWQQANIQTMQDQSGINLVSIIIGVNACKVCAAHAGKIYSTDGTPGGTYELESFIGDGTVTVTVAGTLDDARAKGWNHPNCRCVPVGYFVGLPIAKGTTYNPQGEKDRDRLRELERRVRDLKRRQAAAFSDIDKQRLKARIRKAQADIRQHTAETGLLRRNYREQLGFSDGKPAQLPATPPRAIAN